MKRTINFPKDLDKELNIALNNYRLAHLNEYMSLSSFVCKLIKQGLEIEFFEEEVND